MSDRGIATLTIIASTEEAQEQLKIFVQKCRSTNETFSLDPLFPKPKDVKENDQWYYSNWGTKWDAYNSKILLERQDKFVIEFQIINGPFAGWLEKVSKDFPDLYFYNRYYFGPWEGECLLEGKNGDFINHYYSPSIPTEISNYKLEEYVNFALLKPTDAAGKPFPFSLKVINSTTVLISVRESMSIDSTSGILNPDFYRVVLCDTIERISEKKNFVVLLELNRDETDIPCVEYSFLIKCQTIQEAVEKTLQQIEEFHRPLSELIQKVKNLLIEELKIDKSRFTLASTKPKF